MKRYHDCMNFKTHISRPEIFLHFSFKIKNQGRERKISSYKPAFRLFESY